MRRQQQPVGAESLETHVTGVHIPHAQCHLRQQQVGGRGTRPPLSLSLSLSPFELTPAKTDAWRQNSDYYNTGGYKGL